jgi:hypothetical protein
VVAKLLVRWFIWRLLDDVLRLVFRLEIEYYWRRWNCFILRLHEYGLNYIHVTDRINRVFRLFMVCYQNLWRH